MSENFVRAWMLIDACPQLLTLIFSRRRNERFMCAPYMDMKRAVERIGSRGMGIGDWGKVQFPPAMCTGSITFAAVLGLSRFGDKTVLCMTEVLGKGPTLVGMESFNSWAYAPWKLGWGLSVLGKGPISLLPQVDVCFRVSYFNVR